tara:strand:+ start:423 stop:695 length:273 start_codon:yes stop_codon:yes gene_type:complete
MTNSKAIPTTEKALHYHNKKQLVTWVLSYQAQQEKAKTQLVKSEFIKPSEYISDLNKRVSRNNQEIKNLITDTKNAVKTVKRIISLPSFI